MNGGLPAALSSAATDDVARLGAAGRVGSSPAPARPGTVISSSASCGRRRRAARRRDRRRRGRATIGSEPLTRYDGARSPGHAPSIASIMRHTATDPSTSCTRTMRHPCATPYATDASDTRAPVVDRRGRAGRRGTACSTPRAAACSRGSPSASLSRSSTALCAGVLPRSRPASSAICSGASPAASARAARSSRNAVTSPTQVVVVRLGIGDARLQADVGGHHRRAVLRRDAEVVGIAEAADVVADDRTGLARLVEHRGPPGVARDGDVEALVQRLDRRDDAVELLVLADLGTGSGLHPADVEEVGALGRRAPRRAAGARRARRWRRGRRTSRACG